MSFFNRKRKKEKNQEERNVYASWGEILILCGIILVLKSIDWDNIKVKKETDLDVLERQLQDAVLKEHYEKAAIIRDRIKALTK